MRHSMMLILAVILALASVANASVKEGDVEIEIQGGLTMESTEEGDVAEVDGVSDFSEIFDGATGTDLDGWSAGLSLNRFASDNWQIGIAGFYSDLEGDTETFTVEEFDVDADFDVEMTAFGIGGRARYHFNPTGKWVPYVGAQAFWVSADIDVTVTSDVLPSGTESDSPSGILFGPVAGLRWEMSERDELLFEFQYHLWQGDIGDVIENGYGFFVSLAHRLNE